jgi:hypothetical protein
MNFRIDASEAARLASVVGQIDTAVERAGYRAVNKVASKWYTRSRREITSRVNLSNDYVESRMSLRQANATNAAAYITARSRPTRLSTYGAQQLTTSAPAAQGDASRGIPAGAKQAGVSVLISRRKGRARMPHSFLIPLNNGNGMGVFVRTGTGRNDIKHLYGPSVAGVFSWVIKDVRGDVDADLEKTVSDQLEFELRGIK